MPRKLLYLVAAVVGLIGIAYAQIWILSLDFITRGKILRAQVVLVIQSFLCVGDYVVWKNIADAFDKHRDQSSYKGKNRIWRCILLIHTLLVHLSYMSNVFLVRTEPSIIAMGGYLFLAAQVQLITSLVIFYFLNLFLKFIKRVPVSKSRKTVISVFYAIVAVTFGHLHAQSPPIIKSVQIPIQGLPLSLDGFTITQISDIHLGPTVGKSHFQRIINLLNPLQSDIVVITGDLVDGPVNKLQESVSIINNIQAKHGTYYVTGNHEYYTMDTQNWLKYLSDQGVNVLHNSNKRIPHNAPQSEQLCIVGTDDLEADRIRYEGHGFQLDKAIRGCTDTDTVLLLAHQPQAAYTALHSGHKIDAVLSGHTHGGQMFPLIIGAYLLNPFYVGLYRHGNSHVYVSQGTVYWGMPVRIFTQHEITRITLVKDKL
ncbi:hypothetical protein FSP39_004007 [Pinctada imbricata]|uniref:Calcineurin-like phosphoesterase domain-containing protein n=1 Tax=Pinctada imbricata TaxID=66713 RepID=A0AA88XHI1_PINIB|nr:hypothetical protein FSP39_004007 [Pinctada imbricata]